MSRSVEIRPRIRVLQGEDVVLGPGKADLLEAIGESGSISEAARRLQMSYMRAWTLLRTMNRSFHQPLVETARGGAVRGGATLTDEGRTVLALYRRMEREALAAVAAAAAELGARLSDRPTTDEPSPV